MSDLLCLAAFNNEAFMFLMLLLLIQVIRWVWGLLWGATTLQMEFQTSSVNYQICRCIRSVCQKEMSFRNAVKWTAAMRLSYPLCCVRIYFLEYFITFCLSLSHWLSLISEYILSLSLTICTIWCIISSAPADFTKRIIG